MNDSARPPGAPTSEGRGGDNPWRVFGARVRKARLAAGMEPGDLVMREVCSLAMLAEVEAGTIDPSRALVEYLDHKVGTKGALVDAWARALLVEKLAARAPVTRLLLHAEHIGEFSPLAVPEFLQTKEYAEALAPERCPGRPAPPLREQGIWFASRSRPAMTMVTTEAALRRVVGSAEITHAQLRELRRLVTAHSHLRLHVLPETGRAHLGWRGAFRVLTFSAHHTIVHQPHPVGPGAMVAEADPLGDYTALFTLLQGEALGQDLSVALLGDAIRGVASTPAALTAVPDPSPGPGTPDRDRAAAFRS